MLLLPAPILPETLSTAGVDARHWVPKCVKVDDWPILDQTAWMIGCTAGTPFDPGGHGASLAEPSLEKYEKGYGAWLSFLDARAWLDPVQAPADRITRQRLLIYFKSLKQQGNRDYSVLGRLQELVGAMKVIAPTQNLCWIFKPNGVTFRRLLRPQTRRMVVPDASVLFAYGLHLMKSAELGAPRQYGLLAFRDGLLIALLAARGRRLRSMALLRVGQELVLRDGRYRIELQPSQVKTKKYDAFDLPPALTPFIVRYLEQVRPALLHGKRHDAFWVARGGSPLQAKGIQAVILRRSAARFGVAFGPHRFRHAIATTATLCGTETAGLAAPLLGISASVVNKHYDRAVQVAAGDMFQKIVEGRSKG